MGTIGLYRFAATLLLVCAPACAQLQTQLQIVGNLPKGYLIWTFDDGPDEYVYSMFGQPTNQSLDIATLLADSVANQTGQKISGWFFQNPCHYQGAPTPNPHSANCAAPDFGNIPWSLLAQIVALGHGVGNHGEDHVPALVTSSAGVVTYLLSDAGILAEAGRAQASLAVYQSGPRLYRPAGFTWNAHIAGVLNSKPATRGLTGPFYADFTGAGTINGVPVAADWDCFRQGFGYQACGDLYLQAIRQADHGGIIFMHDRSPDMVGSHNVFLMVQYMLSQLKDQRFLALGSTVTGRKAGGIARQTAEFGAGDGAGDVVFGKIAGNYKSSPCKARGDGIWCALYGDSGLAPATRWFAFDDRGRGSKQRKSFQAAQKFWLADLEGTGKAGLAWEESEGILYAPSLYDATSGTALFGAPRLVLDYSLDPCGWRKSPNYSLQFGRFDKTGRQSLLVRDGCGVRVFLSNGVTLDAPTAALTSTQFSDTQGWSSACYPLRVGDVNGDGVDDICGRGDRAVVCSLVTAAGIAPPTSWTPPDGVFSDAQGWGADFALPDIFGQGKRVPAGRLGSQILFTNTDGASFSGSRQLVGNSPLSAPLYFADLDGDGQEEAVWMLADGLYAGLTQIVLEVPPGTPPPPH